MSKEQIFSNLLGRLGVRHGFTTLHMGDFRGAVETWNHLNLSKEFSFVELNQVHGCAVLKVDQSMHQKCGQHPLYYDASMSNRTDVVLGVRTADCVPILLCSKKKEAVAAVHAGWRGTYHDVVMNTVNSMQQAYGVAPHELVAVMGPSIRRCCYEVGEDLYSNFKQRFGKISGLKNQDTFFLDLVETNRMILLEQGLLEDNIEVIEHCTCCENDRFFSYRRDNERAGRQLSYITLG